MNDKNKVRLAHDILDGLTAGAVLSQENEKLLRGFLPERPTQKTLEEIYADVSLSLDKTDGDNWEDECVYLESWLGELKAQLKGLIDTEPAKPAHPEFLETEKDYESAPNGTIVAAGGSVQWVKIRDGWDALGSVGMNSSAMSLTERTVLRWGWGE